MSDSQTDFVLELLKITAKYDLCGELFWHEDLKFHINCNDFFHWGVADGEPVTATDLELLVQCMEDDEYDGHLLYCARKRGMRPQGACYKHLTKDKWHLYDACGPKRELGLGNPQKRDS